MKNFVTILLSLTFLTTVASSVYQSSALTVRKFHLEADVALLAEEEDPSDDVVVDGEKFFMIDVPDCLTGLCFVQINTKVQVGLSCCIARLY